MKRAVDFVRGFREGMAEEILPAPWGRALLTPSLPRVHYTNTFAVDLGAEATATDLLEDVEPVFWAVGLTHRQVSVDDELGARLAPEFRELGWKVEELLVMPHRDEPPALDTSGVEEVGWEELEPVWAAGMRASPDVQDEEEVRQLVAAQHRRRTAVDVRYFAARVDGRIASYCELFSDEKTGQIESVMTLEEFRRRGLAKAIVTHALAASRAAGHDFTFLLAEAEDWPKELYAKLGFETIGSIWVFLLQQAQ
jgi:ribosomal protein S18 acetylase RimI-like enzyme